MIALLQLVACDGPEFGLGAVAIQVAQEGRAALPVAATEPPVITIIVTRMDDDTSSRTSEELVLEQDGTWTLPSGSCGVERCIWAWGPQAESKYSAQVSFELWVDEADVPLPTLTRTVPVGEWDEDVRAELWWGWTVDLFFILGASL